MNDNTVITGYYKLVSPFVPNAPFFYPMKTSEIITIFYSFQGTETVHWE